MTTKGTGNLAMLAKAAFTNEDAAVELMIELRWHGTVACAHCGGADPYRLKPKAQPGRPARRGLFKCSQCKKQFSVTTGTVFEASHVSLSKWLLAIHLMSASKKGMSAHQLHRMLGVTYRAAWFMFHRLRHAMATNTGLFAKLSGVVEIDETYIGAKRKGMFGRPGPKDAKKTAVIALVERGGRVRAFPMERVTGETVKDVITKEVAQDAHVMTDELIVYRPESMGGRKHEQVTHSRGEYVRGSVHTNTVEGFFGLLKRGIVGTFHHIGKGHVSRYVSEFEFRHNTRMALGYNDSDRAALIVTGAEGKRLTYKMPA